MRTPFAPIEAGTTEDTSGALARRRLECDAEPIQEIDSLISHCASVWLDFRKSCGDERVGYGDPETARQVVVAGASGPQGVFARAGADRLARRRGRQRYSHDAFDHLRYID
jgi:hypothetical protein